MHEELENVVKIGKICKLLTAQRHTHLWIEGTAIHWYSVSHRETAQARITDTIVQKSKINKSDNLTVSKHKK